MSTVGEKVIRFVATPGHTPGTITFSIPLKDGDNEHLAAYWGDPSIWIPPMKNCVDTPSLPNYWGMPIRKLR